LKVCGKQHNHFKAFFIQSLRQKGAQKTMNKKRVLLVLILFICIAGSLTAETVRNITPYLGPITNKLISTTTGSEIKDTALLRGLYYQHIDTNHFQWNLFLYNSDNINESDLWGGHLIADKYFKKTDAGKYVAGIGIDSLNLSSDPIAVAPSVSVQVSHTIYAPYARVGYYFYFKQDSGITFTIMPWGGYEADVVRGDVKTDIQPMFPGQSTRIRTTDLDHTYEYGLVGIQLKVDYRHFLTLKLKYHRKFSFDSESSDLHNASAMLNFYFSERWGLSYRYKYFEEITVVNSYHLCGLSFIF
jgi:hypothetical protein